MMPKKPQLNNILRNPLLCGIDEVGRGCLAGDVCASAVIFKPGYLGKKLKDSKKLTHTQRVELTLEIKENSYFAIGASSVQEIDELNILQATFVAMTRAVLELEIQLKHLETINPADVRFAIDGRDRIPNFGSRHQESFINGDQLVKQISAASILAKVYRDQQMIDLDLIYPQYGFCKHKGYGTKTHVNALQKFGATDLHRKSFAPVRQVLESDHSSVESLKTKFT
jgi:ribonuclease HII